MSGCGLFVGGTPIETVLGERRMKLLRGGAAGARAAHNREVAGSTPAPVTSFRAVRNAPSAPDLAGAFRALLPLRKNTLDLAAASAPKPARFFSLRVRSHGRNQRRHHLAFLLFFSPSLRRFA